ncbi:MAG: hypothetical protein Q4B17_02600 [Lautropia sp.]|nr:hypothetical protein [Lautropia sp.]
MNNRFSPLQMPMTSAALCLLLAACGGGSSGSDSAVSSSPNGPSTSSPADGQGSTITQPGAGSGGSGSGGTGSGSASGGTGNPGSQSPAVPQTTEALLSEQGIRGNVLRSMLDQKLSAPGVRGDAETVRAADGRYGWFLPPSSGIPSIQNNVRLDPDNYVRESRPGIPYEILSYRPLEGSSTYKLWSHIYGIGYANSDTTVPVRPFTLEMPISGSPQLLSLGKTVNIRLEAPRATWNAKPDTPAEDITLTATEALEVPGNALLPFGKAVQTWRGDNQQKVELVLAGRCDTVNTDHTGKVVEDLPSRAPGAELCWNFDLTHLKRQICVMYAVPASDGRVGNPLTKVPSTAEAEARLEEMVDQRSVFAGESGALFWRSGHFRCEKKG